MHLKNRVHHFIERNKIESVHAFKSETKYYLHYEKKLNLNSLDNIFIHSGTL